MYINTYGCAAEVANDLIANAFIYLTTWMDVFEHFKDGDVPLFGLAGKGHMLFGR